MRWELFFTLVAIVIVGMFITGEVVVHHLQNKNKKH